LAETESCIDQYDHFQDALIDLDQDTVEFGSGRGIDLRAQAFLSDGLDPIRTVFLLRLYDGTLDSRRRDWREALESDAFFEAVLEPAVNREGVSFEAMELALEGGAAWLEDRQYQAQRERQERELLRMADGEPPARLDRHEQD